MGWTDIVTGAVDADSPTPASLAVQFRDNAEYNHDHALRGGTDAVPVRLVVARGSSYTNGTGTSVDLGTAINFHTGSRDDDPAFGAAPIVILKVGEYWGNASYADDWATNAVSVDRLYIEHGTLSTTGCTVGCYASAAGSVDIGARIDWIAIGTPSAETAYTDLPSTDTDQDSPFEEDLTIGLRDNESYNHEHAVRCGTHTKPVRLAIARGKSAFTMNGVSAYDFIEVVFATDADDGDPNFLSAPVVVLSLEEDKTTDDDWDDNSAIVKRLHISTTDEGSSVYTTVTNDKFFYSLQVNDGNAAHDFGGYVHWIAIGPVAAGE